MLPLQGWQTLVGFVLYHLLHLFGRVTLTPLDMAGYISLFPYFLLFCSAILTGSMALAKISLPAFLSLSALVPVTLCLLGHYERRRRANFASSSASSAPSAASVRYQLSASLVVVASNAVLLWMEQPEAQHDGYFWMEVHCLCSIGMALYGKIADARY